jgi:4-amino-4-deoxy-L-arabinose transferase-like glycosyltransferase
MSFVFAAIPGADGAAPPGRTVSTDLLPLVVLVALLAVAVSYWLWFGLALRTINNGDGISILAAQGVLEHGYQRTPSGLTYGRGYLFHYLVAGAVALFGLNNFAIMLPSLLMGLGSLVLVYRIAVDVVGRPWLGVTTVMLLLVLPIETWYATSPRMYMPIQFFTLLATYSVWRGYIEGERRYRVIALAALIAGMLSNQEGAFVALALSLAAAMVMWLRGASLRTILSRENVVTAVILGAATLFIATYKPPGAMPLVLGHAGAEPARIGLNLNPINWGRHVLHLERSIPYSLAFLLISYFALFKALRGRLDPTHRWTYLFAAFTLSFLAFGAVVKTGGHRLLFFLLPIYALMVTGGVAAVVSLVSPTTRTWLPLQRGGRWIALALVTAGVGTSVGLSTLKQLSFRDVRQGRQSAAAFMIQSLKAGPSFGGLARDGYGLPCGYSWRCDRTLAEQFERLRRVIGPDDAVITMIPMETNYFLGRVDGWLFFRKQGGSYPTLEKSPTDEYFGVQIIDTPEEVRQLAASDRRVWVISDGPPSAGRDALLDGMWSAITQTFDRYDEGPHFVVYVTAGSTEAHPVDIGTVARKADSPSR